MIRSILWFIGLAVIGTSAVRGQTLPGRKEQAEPWEEKVDQIRLYSGGKYETLQEAPAGTVCTVTGLTRTYPGEGLGVEADSAMPVPAPVRRPAGGPRRGGRDL